MFFKLKIVASLPMFGREWASELESRVRLSNSVILQFICGSDESPVSYAKMLFAWSLKHSSIESNPDFEPNIEYQGVQIWAG